MRDPSVDFYKPFQSGEGMCNPIYPWNYYNVPYTSMYGGKKHKHKKGGATHVSYANGMNCGNGMTELDLKNNFGPFMYPPKVMPMNPQDGGNKRRKMKGGDSLVGPQFATQPLVPSIPSTPADYVGNAYLTSPDQKMALTGLGVPQQPTPLTKEFLSNNMGVTYQTQAGGKKNRKMKGGTTAGEYYFDKLTGSYSPTNADSGDQAKKADTCGGAKKKHRKHHKGGYDDSALGPQSDKLNDKMDVLNGTLGRANAQTGGIMYRGAPGPNQTSNMVNGDTWHPEWTYDGAGGKKKHRKMKGGNEIPTPGADWSMDHDAGVATQMSTDAQMQKHIKGAIDGVRTGSSSLIVTPEFSGQVGNLLPKPDAESMDGGAKKKTKKKETKKKDSKKKDTKKKHRKMKGGNEIPTPGAQFSPDPAGVQVQMGQGEHIIKGATDGIAPGNSSILVNKNFAGPAKADVPSAVQMPAPDAEAMEGGAKKKKTKSKAKKGGDGGPGSDYVMTLMSRGPANYPDGPSADRFRFFTKTADFIPNSMLKFAAAPQSTGFAPDPNPYPLAYNDTSGGAKKKSKDKKDKKHKKK